MLLSVGLDAHTTRLDVRERFHLEDADLTAATDRLQQSGIREAVWIRTCNRVEAICWWPGADAEPYAAAHALCGAWVAHRPGETAALFTAVSVRRQEEAVRHLLRVGAGLESQVLGDIHILGQLRQAYRAAVERGSVSSHLHRLFETTFRVGKRVRRETSLMSTRSGVGSEGSRWVHGKVGDLRSLRCVVVGCGKIGAQAARGLVHLGAEDLTLVNRNPSRATRLARELPPCRTAPFSDLPRVVADADVVIVATGAPEPILQAATFGAAGASAGGARSPGLPRFVLDLSVPRNVDRDVAGLPGVELVDLDRLHPEGADVEHAQAAARAEAEAVVEAGVAEFADWLGLKPAESALRPFREVLSEICRRELAHLAGGESAQAERTAERIVARAMARPMAALREARERGEEVETRAGTMGLLFTAARGAL